MMFKWDKWCTEIVNEFGFGHLLPPVHKTGVVLGKVTDSDLCCETSVITGAGHDSAAAVSATPDRDGIFISCGTWSAIGTISDRLITDRAAFENGFTNQRNVEGNKFMTSFSALWILQQCVLEWGISYDKAEQLAEKAAPLERFIDVENELFFQPGQMTARIETFLKATGQTLCTDIGGVTRCILESIAVKYGAVVKKLENLTSRYYDTVCILGGGTRSGLLCGFTAEATGKRVLTGSPESATLGNSLIQLMALGEIEYEEFSKVVSASVSLQEYLPENTELWCEKAILFSDICAMRF
jgi:sugar (pentulose or hexulose) kinase